MEPESMVHALEQIHDLLVLDGYLIDIRPNGEKSEFICRLDEGNEFIGYYEETDDYIEYRQAAEAVQAVVAAGLFKVIETGGFEFFDHADSFDELYAFVTESWSDALVPEQVITRARELGAQHNLHKFLLREHVHISLLQRV